MFVPGRDAARIDDMHSFNNPIVRYMRMTEKQDVGAARQSRVYYGAGPVLPHKMSVCHEYPLAQDDELIVFRLTAPKIAVALTARRLIDGYALRTLSQSLSITKVENQRRISSKRCPEAL